MRKSGYREKVVGLNKAKGSIIEVQGQNGVINQTWKGNLLKKMSHITPEKVQKKQMSHTNVMMDFMNFNFFATSPETHRLPNCN